MPCLLLLFTLQIVGLRFTKNTTAKIILYFIIICSTFKSSLAYTNSSSNVVYFNEAKSIALLKDSNLGDFVSLSQNFEAQQNPTYCGIATALNILNAIFLPIDFKDGIEPNSKNTSGFVAKKYFQELLLNEQTDKIVKPRSVIEFREGNDPGLSLTDMKNLFEFYKLKANVFFSNDHSYKTFKNKLIEHLVSNDDTFIVVNFNHPELGFKKGGGHISPLFAYNAKEDMVLVGDVSASSNQWFWVSSELLYKSMNTKDGQNYRGFIVVYKDKI
jgi:hypothetical protein